MHHFYIFNYHYSQFYFWYLHIFHTFARKACKHMINYCEKGFIVWTLNRISQHYEIVLMTSYKGYILWTAKRNRWSTFILQYKSQGSPKSTNPSKLLPWPEAGPQKLHQQYLNIFSSTEKPTNLYSVILWNL